MPRILRQDGSGPGHQLSIFAMVEFRVSGGGRETELLSGQSRRCWQYTAHSDSLQMMEKAFDVHASEPMVAVGFPVAIAMENNTGASRDSISHNIRDVAISL